MILSTWGSWKEGGRCSRGTLETSLRTGEILTALRTARRASRRQRRAQALLTSLAPEIAGTLDEEEALRRIVGAAVEFSDADGGVIAARDP